MSESRPETAEQGREWEALARGAAKDLLGGSREPIEMQRELLVFGLDRAAYAVSVEHVREIVRMRELTPIPRAPAWLLGVVSLRGEIVEVLDLRRRLGLGASTPDRSNRIVVLHGDVDRVAGLLVDSVSEVHRVPEEAILPAQGLDLASVGEICTRGDEFVSILDLDRVLGVVEVDLADRSSGETGDADG